MPVFSIVSSVLAGSDDALQQYLTENGQEAGALLAG